MMPYIYDLTDGYHHYVGQTTKTLKKRYQDHMSRYYRVIEGREDLSHRRLTEKLTEVGPNLFQMEMLFQCEEYELDQLESWVIDEYFSLYGEERVLNAPKGFPLPVLKGEDHPNAKITWELVNHIRYNLFAEDGLTATQIAEELGLTMKRVSGILRGRSWIDENWNYKDYSRKPRDMWDRLLVEHLPRLIEARKNGENMSALLRELYPTLAPSKKFRNFTRDRISQIIEEAETNGRV